MNNFNLEPGDILVNVNDRNDLYSVIKRWMAGPYEHVFMYMGQLSLLVNRQQKELTQIPLLFESNGRGVVLRSLSERYGDKVVVLRLISEYDQRRIPQVLLEAIKLASSFQSFYDYFGIVRWVLPRLILEKLGLPIPLAWQRDERQICSEAIFEVFIQAKVPILVTNIIPLPGDFVTDSSLLEELGVVNLSEELLER